MSVFSKLRDFLGRHRGKFIVGGVLVGGSILLTRYAQQRLKDWQERETRDFLERTRKQQHFESTERTCNQTILSLSSTLFKTLNNVIDTQTIINDMKSNPENANKLELWNRLRLLVLSRITCLIYMAVMLVVSLRIQLNIVGGYLFKDANAVSTQVQENYLSLCNNLLDCGLQTVADLIEGQFEKLLENIQLSKKMRLRDFDNLFWSIQTLITTCNGNPVEKFKDYLITNTIPNDDLVLNNMIRDTADLLESDEVKSLTTHCLSRGFTLVSDELSQFYLSNSDKSKEIAEGSEQNGFIHPSDVRIPFAKVLPIMNAMTANGTLPDTLVTQLIMNDRLKTLGANVYECFSENS